MTQIPVDSNPGWLDCSLTNKRLWSTVLLVMQYNGSMMPLQLYCCMLCQKGYENQGNMYFASITT